MGLRPLKHSLALTFAFAATVPIILVSFLVLNYLAVDSTGQIEKKNLLFARAMSGQVEVFMREPVVVMRNISMILRSNPNFPQSKIQELLDIHVEGSDIFESIYILDSMGIVRNVGMSPGKQEFEKDILGINLAHLDIFQKVRETGQPTWSDTFLSLISGRMSLALGMGLDNRTLVGNCSIELLADFVHRINVESSVITMIVDRSGAIIVHPDPEIAARQVSISHLPPIREGFAGNEGTFDYTIDNEDFIGSVSLIPGPGWLVMVSQTKADAYEYIVQTAKYFLIGVLGAILLALFFTLVKARSFSRPLSEFAARAKVIADGNYDFSLEPPSYVEEKELAESFHRMTDAVRDREHALQESEKRFREIFNAVNEAIIIYDSATGEVIEVNPAMLDMYGYTRKEALTLVAGDLSSGEIPFSQQDVVDKLKKASTEGPQLFEWQARQKSGNIFWTEVALKSTTIGGQGMVLAVIRDISERKRLEGELFQAQKMEALGTLAGGIAHDFNNILAAIVGYTELVKNYVKDDPKASGYISGVMSAAFRAGDLVKQILTFSRGTEKKKVPLQAAPIVKETMKMLRSSIPTTIEIRTDVSSIGVVLADPTQIHQIIMNLCTNAYHAMRDTGGILGVALKDIEVPESGLSGAEISRGDYILLEVSDTGSGMDGNIRSKIFEPYFTTKEPGQGTGLGLAVVHGIVKSHGGFINLYSEPGQGTTFHVYLPRLITDEAVHIPAQDKVALKGGDESIMLVDDEKDIVAFTQEFLSKFGYRVTTYTNAVQAYQDFQVHPERFDIVITDMTMPYMTGAQLAQKLIELKPGIPIILCTGYSELVHKEKAQAMGITEYLEKPVIMENMIRTVRRVLDGRAGGNPNS